MISFTKPEAGVSIDAHPWFLGAKRILDATFPADKSKLRIADLGCREGGYTIRSCAGPAPRVTPTSR